MAQPHQQQPPSTASPSQIPVPVIPPPPPTPTPTPARHSASASASSATTTTTTTATRRASTSIHPASPARSRISTPSASVASASSNAPPTITPTTTTATTTTAPPPLTSSAQLTAAQALAQQPTTTAHHTPSLFGGPSLFGSVLPQNQELNRAYGAVLPLNNNNNNNPSTRILSSANISTPVPSSASSSATFLTGRSQPPPQSIHAAATTAAAGARTASPFIRHNTTGSNTPSRIGQGSNITLMPGVPLPLSFNSTTGSPRIHSAQHHTGIYTAPHFYTSAVGAAASAAAVSAASAGSAGGGGGGPSTMGSRGSPTPRNMNMPGGAYPQAGGGIPTSPPSGLSGFPAWYRHPTSGLLPLLEVPSALLSAGSATATRSAPRTGSTSALLRSSAGLALHAGRPPSSSTNTTGATTTTQVPNPLHAGPIAGGAMAEDTLVSFSWVIGELALLRDEVERTMPPGDEGRSVSAGAGRNPVWTTQPCFGDPKLPKWKLELVRTQRNRTTSDEDYHPLDENLPSASSASSDAQQTPLHAQQDARSESGDSDDTPRPDATTVLSVYLTSLALEYLPSDALIPATIMLGLQPARTTLSRLQSRQGAWLWQTHSSFVFRREHEFFECHSLPSLSELLEMEEVRAQDALRLVVQIGCGPGIVGPETEGGDGFGFGFGGGVGLGAEGRGGEMLPMPRLAPFQMPSAHYVSQTILDAMEGLVDCARTGDVRIIVRERGLLIRPPAVGVGAGAATRSDDGHFEEEQGGQQAYVIPYPVGSYFPLDVAESAEQQAMAAAAMEHSGVLPEDATTPTASVVVRDRIIWAHSSVLRARSQYFADMMDGGFAEAQDELDNDLHAHATSDPGTSRAIKTFRIPDSEWATVYWLIRYLYLEEIEFAEREDVRSAALDNEWQICAEGLYPEEGGGRGGQTRPNWEWRTISELLREEEEDGDGDGGGGEVGLGPEAQMHYSNTNTNVTSVDRAATGVPSSSSGTKLAVPSSPSSSWRGHPGTIYSSSHPPPKNLEAQGQGQTSSSSSSSAGSSTLSSTHSEQHRLSVSSAASMHVGHDAFVAQSQPGGSGSGSAGAGGEGGPGMSSASTTPVPHHHHEHHHHHQHSPSNIIRHASTMNDPHEHPAARAPPASALATYKLAHRYGQVGLAELAKVHIVETLSPQSAFPVLLATALYSGLHEAIKRYVYEHWDEVSHTEEFERCCDEVGAGEWGAEAGRSLRIFMQSLLSPARILLASPQR